jgi:hypothetical protein
MIRALLLAAAIVAMAGAGQAHDAAQWIQDGRYKNAVGDLCCGTRDCAPLAVGDVEIVPGGYRIKSLDELVPLDQATPAPPEGGGMYWRCYWGGKRKCFFAPMSSS